MNSQLVKEMRSAYGAQLAVNDRAVARLVDECMTSPGLCAQLGRAADAVLTDPKNLKNYDATTQKVLAILMHQGAMTVLLSVIDRAVEIEECGR